MVLGALAVAIIFPQSQIDVVHGTIKTFKVYLESLGIPVFLLYFGLDGFCWFNRIND